MKYLEASSRYANMNNQEYLSVHFSLMEPSIPALFCQQLS